jgi:hypothetical protein
MTWFSYFASTMKHRRAGEVSAVVPNGVVRTEEMPVLATVLSRVVLLIVSATPRVSGRRSA